MELDHGTQLKQALLVLDKENKVCGPVRVLQGLADSTGRAQR